MSAMIDALEGIYLVRRLRPYFANVGKRLVKAPKLYVSDTGLLDAPTVPVRRLPGRWRA